MSESGPLLATRRTFAMPSVGIPDWIKTDKTGNVYAGCGDGVNVCNDFRMSICVSPTSTAIPNPSGLIDANFSTQRTHRESS